jgi:hypothetical protein
MLGCSNGIVENRTRKEGIGKMTNPDPPQPPWG